MDKDPFVQDPLDFANSRRLVRQSYRRADRLGGLGLERLAQIGQRLLEPTRVLCKRLKRDLRLRPKRERCHNTKRKAEEN